MTGRNNMTERNHKHIRNTSAGTVKASKIEIVFAENNFFAIFYEDNPI
jgi:hypothetical protein